MARATFRLSTFIQSDEDLRRGVRQFSKEARRTAWRPKYKVGMPVLDAWGDQGLVDSLSPGRPNGYKVVVLKGRYHPAGTIVFWPEANIRAHRRSIRSVATT